MNQIIAVNNSKIFSRIFGFYFFIQLADDRNQLWNNVFQIMDWPFFKRLSQNGENVSPEELENKLALNPLVAEVIVTGEENGLTARIYPEQAVVEAKALDTEMIRLQLQAFLDEYNKNQPTYRRITGLVIRKNPFIRSTTKKIRRQDVLIDEPQA